MSRTIRTPRTNRVDDRRIKIQRKLDELYGRLDDALASLQYQTTQVIDQGFGEVYYPDGYHSAGGDLAAIQDEIEYLEGRL